MPVLIKPQWADVSFGTGYRVTCSILGDAIFLSQPSGFATTQDVENALDLARTIAGEVFPEGQKYIQIEDYSNLTGVSLEGRKKYIEKIRGFDQIRALIYCGVSPLFRLSIKLGRKLNTSTFSVHIVNDYTEAVTLALQILSRYQVLPFKSSLAGPMPGDTSQAGEPSKILDKSQADDFQIVSHPDWHAALEGFSVRYEVINGEVFHAITTGFLEEDHIEDLFAAQEKVFEASGLPGRPYYFVGGVAELEGGSRKARKRYYEKTKEWYEKHPFKMYVFYGVDNTLRAAINMAKHFVPFKVRLARDLNHAMKLVAGKKNLGTVPFQAMDTKRDESGIKDSAIISKYADEFLAFLGSINWESGRQNDQIRIDPKHPFSQVYEALMLVKADIDDLFRERQKAVEALRESREKYYNLFNQSSDGIMVHDSEGHFIDVNNKAIEFFGYSKPEILKLQVQDLYPSSARKQLAQAFKKALKGENICLEVDFTNKSGKKFTAEVLMNLFESGSMQVIQEIVRDISDRKRAEGLQQAKIKAETANQAKNELLANISHEVRTPLNGIIGMAELLQETDLDPMQAGILETVNTEADALLEIINEMLDFSQIETGKQKLHKVPFNLRNLIDEAVGSFASRAERKGIRLSAYLPSYVPDVVLGDPGRLRQVLLNLVNNAVKFTTQGEIFVYVTIPEHLDRKAQIAFFIKDTGPGIPKEQEATIFNFSGVRGDSTSQGEKGTGLGLMISKRFVEMMGGSIGVVSEENKGCTFWFQIPFFKPGDRNIVPEAKGVDLSGENILVVNDNQTQRYVVTEYLNSFGASTVEAESGEDALRLVQDSKASGRPFNLVVMDIQIPHVNGIDLIREISAVEKPGQMPVVALATLGQRKKYQQYRDLGIKGCVYYPVRRDVLFKEVLTALGRSSEGGGIQPTAVSFLDNAREGQQQYRVLLVEDYAISRKLTALHLKKAGYQVDIAEDGQQALEEFQKNKYDLVLMDVKMPKMDGYQATKAIREIEASRLKATVGTQRVQEKKVPIVAVTAHAVKGYREKCLKEGMDDYLTKPLRKDKLLAIVSKWILKKQVTDETGTPEEPETRIPEEALIIDFDGGVDALDGDRKAYTRLLRDFINRVSEQMKTIRQAISKGDSELVEREAHSIKGGAANLRATALSDSAWQLEKIGRSGTPEETGTALENIEKEHSRLWRYIREQGIIE